MLWIHMLRLPGKLGSSRNEVSNADLESANAGFDLFDDERDNNKRLNGVTDASDFIVDIREFDVPYHVRVAIDKGRVAVIQEGLDNANKIRHSYRKMVHCGSKAWHY